MGKASKWFRGLLGLKKSSSSEKPPPTSSTPPATTKEKRRWSFVKSYREKDHHHHNNNKNDPAPSQNDPTAISSNDAVADPNKHAIAVAAATAAVAEAAVAAAQAAAAVVRLTSSGRCANNPAAYVSGGSTTVGIREQEWAAVKIQAAFRGCLARRALRALKGLVRLQALVRGHIERKKTAERWQQLHAVLRVQARARAGRTLSELSQSSSKSSYFHQPGPATPEKFEHAVRSKIKHEQSLMLRRNSSKANGRIIIDRDKSQWDERSWDYTGSSLKNGTTDDEKNDRVLEIDTGKPHIPPKRRNLFHSSHLSLPSDQNSHSFTTSKDSTTHQTLPSPSSCEVQSLTPLEFSREVEEDSYCTANSSPQFYSASSRGATSKRSPFTPTKSDGSRSHLSGYSDYPNYMTCTESSKAKLRSLSAPKQRPQYERSVSAKRYSVHGSGELRSSAQRASALHANFASKAYPGSGRLDKLGMPVGYRY